MLYTQLHNYIHVYTVAQLLQLATYSSYSFKELLLYNYGVYISFYFKSLEARYSIKTFHQYDETPIAIIVLIALIECLTTQLESIQQTSKLAIQLLCGDIYIQQDTHIQLQTIYIFSLLKMQATKVTIPPIKPIIIKMTVRTSEAMAASRDT